MSHVPGTAEPSDRPWLTPIVPVPSPRRSRRRFVVGGLVATVAVIAVVVGIVTSVRPDPVDPDEASLATTIQKAMLRSSVTMTAALDRGPEELSEYDVSCEVLLARCQYVLGAGTGGSYIVDGISHTVYFDPEYVVAFGGPDLEGKWAAVPLRDFTDADLRLFGQVQLFSGLAPMVRAGDWRERTESDGVISQRIVVSADRLASLDTEIDVGGTVFSFDEIELVVRFDAAENLVGYSINMDSPAVELVAVYDIVGFDGRSTIDVPSDAVPIDASLLGI